MACVAPARWRWVGMVLARAVAKQASGPGRAAVPTRHLRLELEVDRLRRRARQRHGADGRRQLARRALRPPSYSPLALRLTITAALFAATALSAFETGSS